MENEKIKELLKGIVVAIDDEIEDEESNIYKIIDNLKENGIPVLPYKNIPGEEILDSFDNVSFVILDWKFASQNIETEDVKTGAELSDTSQNEVIDFLQKLLDKLLVPIFIFTNELTGEINQALKEHNIKDADRIFIEAKNNLITPDDLFERIGEWMEKHPSVYVLKKWDKTFINSRNKAFLEMYSLSPYWTVILWEIIKKDHGEENGKENLNCHRALTEFLTKSITNRMGDIEFDVSYFEKNDIKKNKDDYRKILEPERYIKYDNSQENIKPHTGDLFKYKDKYYLNIRAECDLVRGRDPELYCLIGKSISSEDITDSIPVMESGEVMKLDSKRYEGVEKINEEIKKWTEKRLFYNGTIIEKAPEAIIPCIAGEKLIKFQLGICVKKFSEMQQYRIGKLLPPYITRIQQRCASHIVRAGTFPILYSIIE